MEICDVKKHKLRRFLIGCVISKKEVKIVRQIDTINFKSVSKKVSIDQSINLWSELILTLIINDF